MFDCLQIDLAYSISFNKNIFSSFNLFACHFRLSVNGGNDKHSYRKNSGGCYNRNRFAKSPEQMEGTLSMTTIEEEQDNISVALSLRNLSQIDEKTSITSFNECSD